MTPPSDAVTHALSVTRHIAAPPAQEWQVMTDRLTEWWCPKPWTTEIIALERRPGGRTAMVMRGPNGEQNPIEGVILAWDEGQRWVSTDAVNAAFEPTGPFMVGVWEIAPEGEGTRYTATARHWTEEACRQHAELGFEQGWMVCADQLAALCEA